jgi:cytochrome c
MRLLIASASLLLIAACGGQPAEKTDSPPASSGASSTAPATPPAAGPTAEQSAALLASLPAPYNAADLESGRREYLKCRSCHTLDQGGSNGVGPNLWGVFGRTAGTVAGFSYSEPVKAAGFAWDAEKLDQWLAGPKTFLPGNRMAFNGIADENKRRDVIAYIKVNTGYAPAQ